MKQVFRITSNRCAKNSGNSPGILRHHAGIEIIPGTETITGEETIVLTVPANGETLSYRNEVPRVKPATEDQT